MIQFPRATAKPRVIWTSDLQAVAMNQLVADEEL